MESRRDAILYLLLIFGARRPGQVSQLLAGTQLLDAQTLHLFDEHKNRATSRPGFLATRFAQTLAPPPQRFELIVVQTHTAWSIARRGT